MTYTTEVLLRYLLDACTHVFAICPRTERPAVKHLRAASRKAGQARVQARPASPRQTLLGSHCYSQFRPLRRLLMGVICSRLDPEPRRVQCRKEK